MFYKTLLFLAVRDGCLKLLTEQVPQWTRELYTQLEADNKAAVAMLSLEKDMFRTSIAPVRAYDATIELVIDSTSAEPLMSLTEHWFNKVASPLVQTDLCAAVLGQDHIFVRADPSPIRFQYLMRRRHDFSHKDYSLRNRTGHSQFGKRMTCINSYVQFHCHPELSQQLAMGAGCGIWEIDSVAELHMDSVEDFAQGSAKTTVGQEAIADEEQFVDRLNSVMFCSTEELRLGKRPEGIIEP